MRNQVLEGQTVRYFDQGREGGKSAIGGDNRGTLAFVDRVAQNNALDLTILTPQGIITKVAVPEANWQPTEFTDQLNKSLMS